MGGFSGPNFSKQGSFFPQTFSKHGWFWLEIRQKLFKMDSFLSTFSIKGGSKASLVIRRGYLSENRATDPHLSIGHVAPSPRIKSMIIVI